MKLVLTVLLVVPLLACNNQQEQDNKEEDTIGSIERLHTDIDKLIELNAQLEVLAEGFAWCEGPVWVDEHNMLLFSDVPNNVVYKWTAQNGLEEYLKPSGYTGDVPRGGEMGSNGLILDLNDNLILCQHGNRSLARMDALITHPQPKFIALADTFDNKRFNSPNDVVQRSNGDFFFTDPPYGLNDQDIYKQELAVNGVYKLDTAGNLTLIIDSLSRPNGLAFTPDEQKLIVGNSDNAKPMLFAYDITADDSVKAAGVVFDFSEHGGGPDGLKIDEEGNIFSSGPGGIWVFNKSYEPIGQIKIPQAVSNCALSADGKTIYITASHQVLRLKMR
ncbi:SMP-30/gluconolactonase/LRE family protein [Olivibacter sp. SDN3]|uniref:SMP-30/gluconolactonase/LRE family protein n=1 Tax=Olivibacter sp. SDN3 TaxID=2764720 RepID=UPI0016516954|nr:SMP-30/gluconolactonase/LRE family protein [Olivibacter sp. SDN3]QNL51006.1 SMP-30/gluconolactonase/LRE family protein [Olivibacter sp. SDN3]